MATIFVDFDGVLHPQYAHPKNAFCCLPKFEAAVRRIPDCVIVISSTWRKSKSFEQLKAPFSKDIAQRIVGVTPVFSTLTNLPDTLIGYEREAECFAWLKVNGRAHLPWVAIDDFPWLFRPFSEHLLEVDGRVGFNEEMEQQLLIRLT